MTGIRSVVYGLGRVGSRIARYATEKGSEVVAGYVRSVESQERLTREFPGLEICLPDRPLRDHRADVLLIAHSGQYSEIYEVARRGAEAGMDVITLSNEGYDPFMLSEHLETSQLLHRIFQQAGRSMVSVGVQDSCGTPSR